MVLKLSISFLIILVGIIIFYQIKIQRISKLLLPTKLVKFLIDLVEQTSSNDNMEEACDRIVKSLCNTYDVDYCTLFLYENRRFITIATTMNDIYIPDVEEYVDSCKESCMDNNWGLVKSSDCMLDYPSAKERGVFQSSIIALKYNQKLIGTVLLEKNIPTDNWEINMDVFKIVPKSISLILQNLKFHYDRAAMAMVDGLTGAYNRRYLEKVLNEQIPLHLKSKSSFTILFFDIDYFKKFNDTYGHDMGDLVLKKVTRFFKDNIRSNDVFFRYGGEEFIVFFPRTKAEEIYNKVDVLRDKLSKHIIAGPDGTKVSITVSMGLSEFPMHGTSIDIIIKCADEAMYVSKNNGRNKMTLFNRERMSV